MPFHQTAGDRPCCEVGGGTPMKLELSLPAGVQADSTSLTKLVSSGAITRYETEEGSERWGGQGERRGHR